MQKQYKNYHGSDQGFSDLVASAKANPTMPAGFTIKSATDIADVLAGWEGQKAAR